MHSTRLIGLSLSTTLACYTCAWVVHQRWADYDPRTERLTCAWGLCRANDALEFGYQSLRDIDSQTRSASIPVFADLLLRNAASPYAWCDLGDALLEIGQDEAAKVCFTRASDLGGHMPPVLMRVVNFHCRLGEIDRALQTSHQLLQLSGDYDDIVFGLYDRLGVNNTVILKQGIGENDRARNAFLLYLLRKQNTIQARHVWSTLRDPYAVDASTALAYVAYNWNARSLDDAFTAWAQRFGPVEIGYPEKNLVYNGDFERRPSDSPFDWTIPSEPYASASIENRSSCSGRLSLHVSFNGKLNPAYHGPRQVTRVKPGTYSFEACVQTEELTSDQGIRFELFDVESPGRWRMETEQVAGTSGWRLLTAQVVVPPPTRALEVRLIRKQSWKFDNALGGHVWVDNIKLAPLPSR